MNAKQTKVTVSYVSKFIDKPSGNEFANLPDDIKNLLEDSESTLRGITENLYPEQLYKITIVIESIGTE